MKEIWKFEIPPIMRGNFDMPMGAEILTVNEQHGGIHIWAIVDPSAPPENRIFQVYGTGHPMKDEKRKYIGTAFTGDLVWHVFEV